MARDAGVYSNSQYLDAIKWWASYASAPKTQGEQRLLHNVGRLAFPAGFVLQRSKQFEGGLLA